MSVSFLNSLEEVKKIYPKYPLYEQISTVLSYYSLYYDEDDLICELDLPILVDIPNELRDWKQITTNIQQTLIKQYCNYLDKLGNKPEDEEREWVLNGIQETDGIKFKNAGEVFTYFKKNNNISKKKAIIFLASIIYPDHTIESTEDIKNNNISIKNYRLAFFNFLFSI